MLADKSIKVLGLKWNPGFDSLSYTIKIQEGNISKRLLLSNVASIFDINGYQTNLVIYLKVPVQRIWISHRDWEDPLPPSLLECWNAFVSEIPISADLRISHHITDAGAMSYSLVGIADSSSVAMADIICLHVKCRDGTIMVNLLRAKSEVALLKTLIIPCLELTAAHLLVKLIYSLHYFT